jgi:hypothetical protein
MHGEAPALAQGAREALALIVAARPQSPSGQGYGDEHSDPGAGPGRGKTHASHRCCQVVGNPGQATILQRMHRAAGGGVEPDRGPDAAERLRPCLADATEPEQWLWLAATGAPGRDEGSPAVPADRTNEVRGAIKGKQSVTECTLGREDEVFETAKHAGRARPQPALPPWVHRLPEKKD